MREKQILGPQEPPLGHLSVNVDNIVSSVDDDDDKDSGVEYDDDDYFCVDDDSGADDGDRDLCCL